jgi:hypothetical protein
MWCLMAHESYHESQKQLHFHLFLDAFKNRWYKCIFIFIFIQIDISHKS